MTTLIYKKVFVSLKTSLLSCSFLLLLISTAASQSQNCTQAQIQANIEKFKDSNDSVKVTAHNAVVACKTEAVNALIKALKHQDANVRSNAASALASIGESAKAAVPQLTETLKQDKSVAVRSSAASALRKIGKSAKSAFPQLIETLKQDKSAAVRVSAVLALEMIKESAKLAVPQLIETLKQDQDADVRLITIAVLERMGKSAKPAVPQLIATLRQDKSTAVRNNTAYALGNIGGSLQAQKEQLSTAELDTLIADFEIALNILQSEKDSKIFNQIQKDNISNFIEVLKDEKQSRWLEQITKQGSIILLISALIGAGVILIYRKPRAASRPN